MRRKHDRPLQRKPCAGLVLALAALSLSPTGLRAEGEAPDPGEIPEAHRTIRILGPADAPYLDWHLLEDWPRSLIATWKLDKLAEDSELLVNCKADRCGDRRKCEAEIRSAENAAAAVNVRIRTSLDDCIEDTSGDPTLGIVLGVLGGVTVGVGVGLLLGWLAI